MRTSSFQTASEKLNRTPHLILSPLRLTCHFDKTGVSLQELHGFVWRDDLLKVGLARYDQGRDAKVVVPL